MATGPADLRLYPSPRRLAVAGPGCRLEDGFGVSGAPAGLVASVPGLGGRDADRAAVRLAVDPAAVGEAGDEAYRLVVDATGVRIAARTPLGLRWGLVTLAQLRRSCGADLPGLAIDDAPAFRQRGFMLDIARDRVPTMASLRALVDACAAVKINHLQLYNEHAFAFAGHEAVWRAADPVTPAELRELDALAASRGVALTANQNSFGHYERWLRIPRYAPLAEVGAPWQYAPWGDHWVEPNTLCPLDPGSLALVEDLFRQVFPCCSGPYANIGGDEPLDLGHGRSREACERLGRGRVFSDYLGQVLRVAQRLGKRPQFWCDPHPNEDGSLPSDLTVLVWGYEADTDFAGRLGAHAAAGREVWVAPGTANWNTYGGRQRTRHGNLSRAAREGAAAGAVGFLNTEWGDNGHRQQWPLTLHGLADGAQAAWTGGDAFDPAAAGLQVLGSAALGSWLDRLGRHEEDHLFHHNNSESFFDGNRPWGNDADEAHLPAWERVAAAYAEAESALPAGGPFAGDCLLAARLARLAADRGAARRRRDAAARKAIVARCCPLFAEYRASWLARSRYGGLEDSYAKLKGLLS